MAKLKDGFYKQTAEAIGSDLYVLLAGGGMKPLADFANTSSVDYANKAGDSDKLGGLPASYYLKVQSLSESTSKLLSDKVWSAGVTNKGDDSTQNECPTYYGAYLSLQYDVSKNQGYQFYGNTSSSTPTLYVRNRQAGNSHTTYNEWKQVAFTSDIPTSLPANGGTADSANKLTTPRTIWGQLFDGTGNITQTLHITEPVPNTEYAEGIRINTMNGDFSSIWFNTTNISGYDKGMWGITAMASGNFRIRGGVNGLSDLLNITKNGNVLIGTTLTSSRYKFAVNGGGIFSSLRSQSLRLGDSGVNNFGWNSDWYYAKIGYVYESDSPDYLRPAITFSTMAASYEADTEIERMRISSSGKVGIGTTTPSKKLTVNGNALIKEITIDAGYVTAHTPSTTGWYTVARVSGYFNFDIYISGGWNHGMPSTIRANICNIEGSVYIMQLAGYVGGHCNSIRLGRVSNNTWDVQVYIYAYSGSIGTQVCSFVGYGGIETYSTSTVSTTSYSATTKLSFTTVWGTPVTSSNYTSYVPTKTSQLTNDNGFVTGGPYLPLSGGTLQKNNDNTPLTINGTTAGAWIAYRDNNSEFLGSIGVQNDKKPYFYGTSLGAVELIHSGNIGSQSVSYAYSAGNATSAGHSSTTTYYTTGPYSEFTNKWDCNAPDRIVYSDYGSSGRSISNAPSGWLFRKF